MRKHFTALALTGVVIGLLAWQVAGCISDAEAGQEYPPATEMIAAGAAINPTTTDITLGSGLQLFLDDGTACTDPGIAFSSEDSGFSIASAAQMAMCVADSRVGEFNTNGISVVGANIEAPGSLTIADGAFIGHASTAVSGTEWSLVATPSSGRTSAIFRVEADGSNWSGGSDATIFDVQDDASCAGLNIHTNSVAGHQAIRFSPGGVSASAIKTVAGKLALEQMTDLSSGDMFVFQTQSTAVELTASSGTQAFVAVNGRFAGGGTQDGVDLMIDTQESNAATHDHVRGLNAGTPAWAIRSDGVATFVTPRGEMTMYEATQTITINTQDVYHAVLGFSTGDVEHFTFDAGRVVDANVTSEADNTVLRIVTSAAHLLTTGDVVTITNANNAGHNGVTAVTVIDGTTFDCDDITYVAGAGASAAVVDEPSYLQASAGAAGEYKLSMNTSSSSSGAARSFKWEININATEPDKCVAQRKYANADRGSIASSCFATIADGDRVWLAVQNKTDTGDLVIDHANLNLHRM